MLSWHVSRASGWRKAWSENLMGTGAWANPCQPKALSPGATHTLQSGKWHLSPIFIIQVPCYIYHILSYHIIISCIYHIISVVIVISVYLQGCKYLFITTGFLLSFPSTGPFWTLLQCKQWKSRVGKQQDGQDMLWLLHTEMGADLDPSDPFFPLSHSEIELLLFFWSSCKAATSKETSRVQLSTSTSIIEKREIFLKDQAVFWEKKCLKWNVTPKKRAAKRNQISWWQRYKTFRPTTACNSWDGLAASPLLSAAPKGT